MAKAQTKFVCRNCGYESAKWLGKCPSCGEWGTLEETVTLATAKSPAGRAALPTSFVGQSKPLRLTEVPSPADEGRLSSGISEFDRVLGGGIVRGALTLIGGEPGIGKCLAGSERVFDPATGAYLPITKWAEQRRPILALDETTHRLCPSPVSMFHAQGEHAVVEVTTRLGRTLRCTPNHPLLTPDGWKPAGDLAPGARVASPRALPFFGSEQMQAQEVRLIAYILSDGSAQSSICVTSMLPEVEADLKQLADHFGMTLRVYPKPGTPAKQLRLIVPGGARAQARTQFKEALMKSRQRRGVSWMALACQAGVPHARLRTWYDGHCVPAPDDLGRLAAALQINVEELAADAVRAASMTTPVASFLEKHGLRFLRAENKAVPQAVFCLPQTQLALF